MNNSCFSFLCVQYEGAANTAGKLSYRVLNRSDQTNDLIVIMSKENGNVAFKIKTTIDRSPVVTNDKRKSENKNYVEDYMSSLCVVTVRLSASCCVELAVCAHKQWCV